MTKNSQLIGPSKTILLVEDDDGVRAFVRLALEQANYVVLATANGDEALELFRRDHARVDLVLTDVVMPIRSGPELVAELHRIRAKVPVVFMSGYTGGISSPPIELTPGTPFLEKPFSLEQLLVVVSDSLGRR